MFNSVVLDVAIGIVFIYLFLSLISSAVTEFLAGIMKMRAKNLEEGIRSILNDPDGKGLTKQFYQHPFIQGITKGKREPSYIPSRVFALTLLDVLAPADMQKGSRTIQDIRDSINKIQYEGIKKILSAHLDAAENNINSFVQDIEKWFDESMERVSGWYKRKSQWIIFVCSIAITLMFNVDTIHMADTLYHDTNLRAGLVAAAEGIAKGTLPEKPEQTKEKITEIKKELEKIRFPIGWSSSAEETKENKDKEFSGADFYSFIKKIIGWTITVFAISLGAPFWFDVLNKFINIRSGGRRPEKKTEETSE